MEQPQQLVQGQLSALYFALVCLLQVGMLLNKTGLALDTEHHSPLAFFLQVDILLNNAGLALGTAPVQDNKEEHIISMVSGARVPTQKGCVSGCLLQAFMYFASILVTKWQPCLAAYTKSAAQQSMARQGD